MSYRELKKKKKKEERNEDEKSGGERETKWDRVKNPRKFNFEAVSADSAVYHAVERCLSCVVASNTKS